MRTIFKGAAVALSAALVVGCVETGPSPSGPPKPTVSQRPNGQVLVNFRSDCQVVYSPGGRVVFRDSTCTRRQMQRARAAYNRFIA